MVEEASATDASTERHSEKKILEDKNERENRLSARADRHNLKMLLEEDATMRLERDTENYEELEV